MTVLALPEKVGRDHCNLQKNLLMLFTKQTWLNCHRLAHFGLRDTSVRCNLGQAHKGNPTQVTNFLTGKLRVSANPSTLVPPLSRVPMPEARMAGI